MDKMNLMPDCLVIASMSSLERRVQVQMKEKTAMSIDLEQHNADHTSLSGPEQQGSTEDVDILEKLGDLTTAEQGPVKMVKELLNHKRPVLQCEAQVKSTLRNQLTNVLPNHLSQDDSFLTNGEKNCKNNDLSICGSQVSQDDLENTKCFFKSGVSAPEKITPLGKHHVATNTEIEKQGQKILLCLNSGNNILQEMICVYKKLESSCVQKTNAKRLGKSQKQHSQGFFSTVEHQRCKVSIPVRLLPLEGGQATNKQNECGISNSTAITSHSKQNSSYFLLPPETTIRAEIENAQSYAQSNGQKSVNEYTSICASINQTSFNKDENPKHTQSHKLLCLEIHPGLCADCVAAGTKVKHEDLPVEEVAKNLCAMDVTYKITLKDKGECTSAGSDKYIYRCEELDNKKTSSKTELTNVNYGDDIVLLDTTFCTEPNLQINKSLPCAKENMSADVLKSATVGPNENESLQNEFKSKISTNEALASEQKMKQIDTLVQGDKSRESITPRRIPLKLAANFGQCVSMPKQIVRTKYTTFMKEENDTKTKCNSVENVTMAKQVPTKTLHISKQTSVKMKDASFDVPHNANSSFNILAWKEREVKRKMSKNNCINQRSNSTPKINKSGCKSLQCLPISTQSWLRKGMLMPSTANFLQCKKSTGFPSLNSSHLHQVSSKILTKIHGGIIESGSTSNEKSHPCDNRNINSLNRSLVTQVPRLNSTSDFSALKYSDMFQEINPVDKGPGIYEMFSSPFYRAMRKSTTCETNHQTVHSVPLRKVLTRKFSKSNRATEKNNEMNIKNKPNSKKKKIDTNVKKKNKQNAEESMFLFKSDRRQENVGLISGHDWHARTFRNEALFHNLESHAVSESGHLSDGSETSHPVPDYEAHLDGQCLPTIMEDSFEQASVKLVSSEAHDNIHKEFSSVSVDGGNPGECATDHCKSSMLPKIKNADYCGVDLFELELDLNKKDEADGKSAKRKYFAGTPVVQEPTAVLSNGLNWDVVVDEAEGTVVCTEDQKNTTSCGAKAVSHPNSNQTSFPVQPLINTWTVEKMSPTFQFECGKEDNNADGLLHCLPSALLLEEKNTYNSTIQMATHVQQKECYDNNFVSENTNEKMIHEKSFQAAEYTVTKLFKTSSRPSSSLCNTIKSECSPSCEDVIIWTKGNVLGKGAYGTVYCGLTSQGQLIAVKQVVLNATNQTVAEKEYQKLEEEIELLKDLKHVNIVHFLGTSLEANVVSIFMEFVPGGSIAGIISRFGTLPEPVFCGYTKQVLKGVDYLHNNKVIHRDIKGNNVMLMPNGVIKLIDFGCAKRMTCVNMNDTQSEMLKSMHGTPYWMAPEVINETGHGKKSDIWSIGCTVFEMACGKPPLAHMDKMAAMFYIGAHRGLMPDLPEQFSKNAQDFVQICLTRDQHKRPSAKQLLQHAFIIKKKKETAIPGK